MVASIDDLKLFYSGGPGNSDKALSVGGTIGNQIQPLSTFSNNNPIPGIFLTDAQGLTGTIDLDFTASNRRLIYTHNAVNSTQVFVFSSTNQTYQAITTGTIEKVLTFRSESALLPATDQLISVTVSDAEISNVIFTDVDRVESLNGNTEYKLVYIQNTGSDVMNLTRLQLTTISSGGRTYTMSIASQTAPNEAPEPGHVADPSTAPLYATSKNMSSILMTPGDTFYVWLRAITATNNTTTDEHATFRFIVQAQY